MIVTHERRAGGMWRGCKCRGLRVNAVDTMWYATPPPWRSIGAFGWIWISRCSLAQVCAKACASFRQQWSAVLESSVGLRTINERINQIEPLRKLAHSDPISEVPPVVQFDGIWLRLQTQTDTVKLDKRQRQRKKKTGKKVVLLVALGFWTDGSGRREILDWHVADGESKAAWDPFVHRLWERGVRPENGLQAVIRDGCGELGEAVAWVYGTTVIEQRCIFHQLPSAGGQEPGGTQRGGEEASEQALARPSQRHLPGGECKGKPDSAWPPLPTPGEREPPKPCRWGHTRAHRYDLVVGAHQPRVARQVSPSMWL